MKSALLKDFFREIKKTKSRFISILLITTLGVGFFVGIRVTGLDMQKTADVYFDKYSLSDIEIMSNYGLTDDDIKQIEKLNNVKDVIGTYYTDILAEHNQTPYVIKLHSFSREIIDKEVNVPQLVSGKFPKNKNELVLEDSFCEKNNITIGDKLSVDETSGIDLKEKELTLVGTVRWVQYLTFDYGTSTLGTGSVSTFGLINENGFDSEVYTKAYINLNNVDNISCYSKEYKDKIKAFKSEITNFTKQRESARLNEIKQDAYKEIDDAKKEIDKQERSANKKIASAKNTLNKNEEKLKNAQQELNKQKKLFNKEIDQHQAFLDEQYKIYNENKAQFDATLSSMGLSEDNLSTTVDQLQNEMDILLQNGYTFDSPEVIALKNQIDALNMLLKTKEDLDLFKSELDKSKEKLEKTKTDTQKLFNKNQKKIDNGFKQIKSGRSSIKKQEAKLKREISDAREKTYEAYDEVNNLEKCKWYVLDRRNNESFFSYEQDADRIVSVAKVFPLFFFLVASLVCLTSMTRMVEEERTQLGTLKALGYSKNAIAFKFIAYAMLASLIGSIFGLIIGFYFIPEKIYDAYRILYKTPDMVAPIYVKYIIIATLLGIASTVISAYFASISELKSVAAQLMRPKSPKMGRKILLEKIPFIWDKINFTWKVTIRNLIRYKKRLIMTVFGVGACVALLIAGLGLRYSISSILDLQFGETVCYDMQIQTENDLSDSDIAKIDSSLKNNEKILSYTWVRSEYMKIIKDDRSFDISLVVPMNENDIYKYTKFKNKQTEKETKIKDDGILLTSRIAEIYGIKEGDYITLKDNDENEYKLKVSEIVDNYVFHYIYLSKTYYKEIFGKPPIQNEIMSNINIDTEEEFDKLSKQLLTDKNLTGITFTKRKRDSFADSLGNMDFVVMIVIFAAGALGFIVLYNLDNINVSERKREFATLKVLGFYNAELHMYVVRENIILTILGIFLGFPMGKYLHSYLMKTVSVDFVQFYPKLLLSSYLTAALLTIIFALLVNIILSRTLHKINMIDSLKSVE